LGVAWQAQTVQTQRKPDAGGAGKALRRLVTREPTPVRDVYSGEAPPWAAAAAVRPSHDLSLRDRLEQSRVVPLDTYRVRATRDEVLVVADLPGVNASEVSFAVDPGLLTILSESAPNPQQTAGDALWQLCRDMRPGRFSQTLPLPPGLAVDRWSATFEEGELRLRIPRSH
jgi:HSP20 family molecular chaperone IbpA